ncbi:MAG: fibronectin type III domain-containing protein, partial [Candidatus Roizmanbacteria bacterium]|nr:fibronectin type III domain-containing protein [Candidatus Roizmanbacteria bacterium]
EPEVSYYWRVQACDTLGHCSSWSTPRRINIDNTAPTGTVAYSTESPTNTDVIATFTPLEPVTVTSAGGSTHTFTTNGTFTFTYYDAAGNTGSTIATVSNIDRVAPAVPTGIYYRDTDNSKDIVCGGYTNTRHLDVYWNANSDSDFYQYEYVSFNADGSTGPIRTFTTNYFNASWWTIPTEGTYGAQIRAVDTAGNKSDWYGGAQSIDNSCKFIVDWSAPTATITYSTTVPTNGDATATLVPSETVTVTNNGGSTSYVFTANGSFTFNFTDNAGNTGTATATVSNIDKTAPATPLLTAPTNNQYLASHDFTFSWGGVTDSSTPITYEWEASYGTGTNVDGSFTSRLAYHSLSSPSVSSPGTPDNIYYWHVRAIDGVGNTSAWTITWKVTVDNYAPVTSNDIADSNWHNTDVTVNLSCTDSGSSCDKTYYQINGGSFIEGSNLTLSTDGEYTISYYSVDKAGNTESVKTAANVVKIDKTLPTVVSVSSDGETYNLASASPTIKITFSEDIYNMPTVEVHTNPFIQSVNNCGDSDAKTFCFTYLLNTEELTHTIYISGAQDKAGNIIVENRDHTFKVDRIAPHLVNKTPFEGWYNTAQTSTFEYTDGIGIASGNNPTCSINSEGTNQKCSVTPNVCDTAGNCNTTSVTSNGADIDLVKPGSIITIPTNPGTDSTVYISSWSGSIRGTASDNLSGVNGVKISIQNAGGLYFNGSSFAESEEYLLDTTYSAGSWHYDGLTSPIEGSYTIKSHAIDNAGNTESTYTLTIILDKTIPEVAISLNPTVGDAANGWYKTQPEVTLTATDTYLDGVEYQWDSKTGAWTTYVAPFKPGSEGAHVLYYRAHDLADNYSDIGVKNIKWNKTDLKNGPLNVNVSPNPTNESTSKVKWDAAVSDTIGIDRYEVQWKLKNGTGNTYTKSVGNDVREYTVDNLTEGVWEVKVTAFDASGNNKSASADLTVDRSGPTAPTLSIFGTAPGSVSLSWSKIDGATNYIIWYGTTPGSYQYGAKVGDTQSFTVQGLGAGTYYFIVKAVDAAGNQGGNSNEVSTGAIAGAPGVAAGTVAQGFGEQVLGTNTLTPTPTPKGSVLGTETKTGKTNLWWWPWILLLLLPPSIWFGYKKWKNRQINP